MTDPFPDGRSPRDDRHGVPSPMMLMGVGIEMTLTILVMGLVGMWLDTKLGTQPWLLITGIMMGAIGSMYKLWIQGRRQFQKKPRQKH